MLLKLNLIIFLLVIGFSLHAVSEPSFAELKETLKTTKTWVYPYPELVDQFKTEGKTTILIFSYGSLMDISSAQRTLSEASLVTRRPAVAYGLKRVYDLNVPITPTSRWCIPNNPEARGMLNVISDDSSLANGVLIDIDIDDIPDLLAREQGYDLVPFITAEWDTTNEHPTTNYKIAYTLQAPQGNLTSQTILPRPGYYELTRNAAKQFGPVFYQLWFGTTYLSDGKTPIQLWEQKVQEQDLDTQSICQ